MLFTKKHSMTTKTQMLIRCMDQFRYYAENHRAKNTPDADAKAVVNDQFADDIAAVLNQREHDVLAQTADFANIAYADGISPKNQQSQLGVHFEEVAEMITEISSPDPITQMILTAAHKHVKVLATQLKQSDPVTYIKRPLHFLDACCDQLVTATLSAKLYGMDPVGGLEEVNRSNYSKLVNGVMTKDPVTAKWLKGPDYSKPDLTPFI